MSIWFIILVTVYTDGKVASVANFPNSPKYNNEAQCNESGAAIMQDEQMKIGTQNGTVFFRCQELTKKEINAATKGDGV